MQLNLASEDVLFLSYCLGIAMGAFVGGKLEANVERTHDLQRRLVEAHEEAEKERSS